MKTLGISIVVAAFYFNMAYSRTPYTEETITFTNNILPILQSNCVSCHPGIVNYNIAFAQKDKILKKVTTKINKQMPPRYVSPRLTKGEVELIKKSANMHHSNFIAGKPMLTK